MQNTISNTEFMDIGNDDEAEQIVLSKDELDTVIDWVNKFLNPKED